MRSVVISLLLVLSASFVLPFTDIPVNGNDTETVTVQYDSVMRWREFTDESLTYREAYCMIHVITIMMNHSQVNLCRALSICSTPSNDTQCEEAYTGLLMTLQENCHWSSQDCDCEMPYTHTNSCVVSIVVAVLCSIVALLTVGAYVHLKYFKKAYQCSKCKQLPRRHCSLPLSVPPVNIPVGQQICSLPGSHHNRRIMRSGSRDIHHVVQHHNFNQEFRSASTELASFLNQQQEYNSAEIPEDSAYETFNFGESVSEQQNQNEMEYMAASQLDIPEYLEILPDLEISGNYDNQEVPGFDDLEHQYVTVGEIFKSVPPDSLAESSEKEMLMVNDKFHRIREETNLKDAVTNGTKLAESGKLNKSSLSEGLPFVQEIQDGENIQIMGSKSSLNDELVEIVIENGNHQFSEEEASLATGTRSLETPMGVFSNPARYRYQANPIHNNESTTHIFGR